MCFFRFHCINTFNTQGNVSETPIENKLKAKTDRARQRSAEKKESEWKDREPKEPDRWRKKEEGEREERRREKETTTGKQSEKVLLPVR